MKRNRRDSDHMVVGFNF